MGWINMAQNFRYHQPFFIAKNLRCKNMDPTFLSVVHGMPLRTALWQNRRKISPDFTSYERSFSLVFWEECLVGATPSTWNFGSTGPRWSEIADFEPIFARSASDVTSSEKSLINTNRKSTTCFPMSLRWLLYVVPKPPKGGSKMQNGRFPSKIALRLNKVCYKVSLCENCQQQSFKAFIGLTIYAKMIGGGDPFYLKFWIKLTALERNCRCSISFSLVATQP